MVAARDDDQIRAIERGARLAQTPGRQQMSAAERLACVDQNDVDVTRERQMLKTIVEDKPIYAAFGKCQATLVAICTDTE